MLFEPVNRAAVCKYMKMITPAKLLRSLRDGTRRRRRARRHRRPGPPLRRADDRHRPAVAHGRVSRRRCPPRAAAPAPAPTWERDVDVVVLGSGAAGLAAALAVRPVRSVLIVTKDVLNAGSTAWAQGGLAGVLDPTDSLEEHVRDTLAAGAGLCDEAVVRELVAEAPTSIRYLMRLGAAFDPGDDGAGPALTREGGHSRNRIVHAGGDRSGAEVQRTLDESAIAAGVDVLERAFALDLVTGIAADGGRQAAGVTVAPLDAGRRRRVGRRRHRAGRRARHRRLRPDLRLDVEPAGRHRRRRRRSPCAPASPSATSSSCSSTRR